MLIYFIFPLIALILNSCNNERLRFFLFVVFFGLFCGARGGGVDLDYYNYLYLWFRNYNLSELLIEPIPKLIFNLFYISGLEYNYSLIFFSITSLYLIYSSCRRYKVNTAVYFVTYSGYFLLVQNMMQVRMSLALAFILYGCVLFSINKKNLGYIFLFLGLLSHQSTILFLLLFLLIYKFSYSYKLLYYIFVTALVFQIQSIFGFDYFGLFFGHIVQIFDYQKLNFYYDVYITSSHHVNVFNLLHLCNLFLFLVCFYIIVIKRVQDKLILFMINMVSIGIIVFNVCYKLPSFSFRISEMTFFFLPFILAYCYSLLNIKQRVTFVFVLYIFANISIFKVVFGTEAISAYVFFV